MKDELYHPIIPKQEEKKHFFICTLSIIWDD